MKDFLLHLICFIHSISLVTGNAEKKLYKALLQDYEPGVRPLKNFNSTLQVGFGFDLRNLLDLDERQQKLTVICYIYFDWRDEYLTWDPQDYEGIQFMYLPSADVWNPDVRAFNIIENLGTPDIVHTLTRVSFDGQLSKGSLSRLTVSCPLDMTHYPYDEHDCTIRFGNYIYSKEELDYEWVEATITQYGYIGNSQFNVTSLEAVEHDIRWYNESMFYPEIELRIRLTRHPTFIVHTVLVPVSILSAISSMAFLLPPDSDAKADIQLSVMLNFAVFMLLMGEDLPPSSNIPMIGIHIVTLMCLTALSLIVGILTLRMTKMNSGRPKPIIMKMSAAVGRFLFIYHQNHSLSKVKPTNQHEQEQQDNLDACENKHDKWTQSETNSQSYTSYHPTDLDYIQTFVKEFSEVKLGNEEWVFVAAVLDRVFLIVLVIAVSAQAGSFFYKTS